MSTTYKNIIDVLIKKKLTTNFGNNLDG